MTQPDIYERLLAALHQPSKVQQHDVTVTTLANVHPTSKASNPPKKTRSRSTPYFGFQSFSI